MFAATAGLATAQDTTSTTHKNARTLGGCLEKSADADGYRLTTEAGGTCGIKSDSVKLEPHVGHTVMVTGVVSNGTLDGLKKIPSPRQLSTVSTRVLPSTLHVTVTNLEMVSTSCEK
jgi:hypothetical protein